LASIGKGNVRHKSTFLEAKRERERERKRRKQGGEEPVTNHPFCILVESRRKLVKLGSRNSINYRDNTIVVAARTLADAGRRSSLPSRRATKNDGQWHLGLVFSTINCIAINNLMLQKNIYIYIYTLYIVLRPYIFQSDLLMTNAEMIAASIMKQSAFPAREGRFHCCNDCTGNTYRKTHATYTYIPITMDTSRTFS